MSAGSSWVARVLTWCLVAFAAIVALKVAAALAAAMLGLVSFVLFTVLPLAVVGWVVVKLFRTCRGDDEFRPA